MKIRTFATVAASLMTLSTAATAQQALERITFQQAIELALKQNLSVRQAENAVENADISVSQSRSSLQPGLGFNVGGGNSFGRVFDPSTGTLSNQMTQSASSGLSSSYSLYDPSRGANISSARAGSVASEADLLRTRQSAVYQVALNFVSYVSARSRLEVQNENLTSLKLSEAQIQRFADAGARPISDLYAAKSNVAAAQLAVVQAEATIENAKFTLMRTLQLDPAKDYDFVAPVIPDSLTTTALNLDSLVTIAYSNRRDIAAAASRVTSAQQQGRAAKAGRMPSLSLSAGYNSSGRFGQDPQPTGAGTFAEQFDQNRGGSVSLGVNFPILDRGNVSLNRRRAEIAEENARLQLASTRQTVALDVRTAWYNIRSAQQQLVAAQAGLTAASQALEATQQRYNVGAATLLEVTQARAQRVNAASSLNDARYNLVLNQAAMSYFTGELDPKTMTVGR